MDGVSHEDRRWARDWLLHAALPLWWERAADRSHGGWYEELDQAGRPTAAAKRCRIHARKAFVFAEAPALGWTGPVEAPVRQGLDFLERAYRRPDGLYRTRASVAGAPVDDSVDLYDQAFVLLGLAAGEKALGPAAGCRTRAEELLERLIETRSNPAGGFRNEEPGAAMTPLRSNPHMHLLEALLAWVARGAGGRFRATAEQIVDLALDRMIEAESGAIGEYFDAHWRFAPGDAGRMREPGHQFEWAYLLGEAGRLLGGEHRRTAARLVAFGERHGVDRARGVALFCIDGSGRPLESHARLWSQTERLRAQLVRPGGADQAGGGAAAAEAFAALRRFLDVPVAGLWRDRMREDGTIVEEPAPTSSLYHIVSALIPLLSESC